MSRSMKAIVWKRLLVVLAAIAVCVSLSVMLAPPQEAFAESTASSQDTLEQLKQAYLDAQAAYEAAEKAEAEPEPAAQPEQAEPAQAAGEAPAASEPELTPAAQTITSVSLTATNPVCGTFVKCKGATMHWPPNYQPAPPISVDTANVSVYGAWWVEGTGPSTSTVFTRNEDITVDGTKYYKFVLNLHADEGYDFTEDTTVSISTGSVLGTEFYPGDEWTASTIIVVLEIPATHDTVTESTTVKESTCTEPGSHKETVSARRAERS